LLIPKRLWDFVERTQIHSEELSGLAKTMTITPRDMNRRIKVRRSELPRLHVLIPKRLSHVRTANPPDRSVVWRTMIHLTT
jgi:hypothetical protein